MYIIYEGGNPAKPSEQAKRKVLLIFSRTFLLTVKIDEEY